MSLRDLQARYAGGELPKAAYIDAMSRLHRQLFDHAAFIAGTDVERIDISGGEVVFTVKAPGGGLRLTSDPDDHRMAPLEILNFGRFDPDGFPIVQQLITEDAVVLDIGANIGWYTLQAARMCPRGRVLAFEPVAATYRYLQRNLELNGAANVEPFNIGLWRESTTLTFYVYPTGSVNASAANVGDKADAVAIPCVVRTVDEVLQERGLKATFIKCDVEGAELRVFEGAERTLRLDTPVVYAEMLRKWAAKFGYHPNDLMHYLAQFGYACFTARDGGLQPFAGMTDATTETDFFFLHPQRHAAALQRLNRQASAGPRS